jgi:hypothetical protein
MDTSHTATLQHEHPCRVCQSILPLCGYSKSQQKKAAGLRACISCLTREKPWQKTLQKADQPKASSRQDNHKQNEAEKIKTSDTVVAVSLDCSSTSSGVTSREVTRVIRIGNQFPAPTAYHIVLAMLRQIDTSGSVRLAI